MTLQPSYTVYLAGFISGKNDHHAIYVDIEKGIRGHKFHVVGSLQNGMTFEAKETVHPFSDAICLWMKPVGRVSQKKFAEVEGVCQMVPAPVKQYEKMKLLVPKDQIRHCQHWAAEAIEALRNSGVLESPGPNESGDIIYRHEG